MGYEAVEIGLVTRSSDEGLKKTACEIDPDDLDCEDDAALFDEEDDDIPVRS